VSKRESNCPNCAGYGWMIYQDDETGTRHVCPRCKGTGRDPEEDRT
jgi:DnaJ-class molecular chaperone